MNANPVWSTPNFGANMPKYDPLQYGGDVQQVGSVYNWNPYQQASGAARSANAMNQQLGIQGPTDYRQAAYKGLNSQLSNALTAIGASGAGGAGVAQSRNMQPIDQFSQAGAALESNFANMQQAYDQGLQQQAMGILGQGQQSAQYGAGLGMQANLANQQANLQNQQFGAGFNANQALQAYQMNQLSPWEFDAMLRLQGGKKEAQRVAAGQAGIPSQNSNWGSV